MDVARRTMLHAFSYQSFVQAIRLAETKSHFACHEYGELKGNRFTEVCIKSTLAYDRNSSPDKVLLKERKWRERGASHVIFYRRVCALEAHLKH